ncbi:MAG TPA: DNA-formamidopyrimidine glycosylase family protein [Jatrophihabitans sp.]|nr:DNA-formamidopyrimidine glycosylase family protein [Jatrophihabitans sp.]
MPEGDTVWLTAHRLHQALSGRVLTTCDFRVPALATVDLRGRSVTEVLPRGKHILARLDDDRTVHSHLKMDGSWYISRARGRLPRRHPAHLIRVLLGNAEWLATGYRIHDLRVVARADEAMLVGHLGPDLLGPDWDAARAVDNLRRVPDLAIGEALLDQRNLAGIGNLYKSEVLFVERVHPWRPVADIAELHRLVSTAHRLMRANRDHPEQSTTGFTRRGQAHWVYERTGEACLRCRTRIESAEQGTPPRTRISYWCPSCQPSG